MTKLRSAGEDFDGWVRDVRDPAERATEGKRVIASGDMLAEYDVAPLPGGGWAMRMLCRTSTSGMSVPWREYPTREECVAAFLAEARAFFDREGAVGKSKAAARRKIIELLSGEGMFGFVEPEPTRE